MMIPKFFLTFAALISVMRTIFRIFSDKRRFLERKIEVFASLVLCVCAFSATKNVIMLALGTLVLVIFAFQTQKMRLKRQKSDAKEVLDDLISIIASGFSLEAAIRELSRAKNDLAHAWAMSERPEARLTKGQKGVVLEDVLRFCRENPSQSYRILVAQRHSLHLQSKLQRRHRAISLQARAQGVVCMALFVFVFLAEWLLLPGFSGFLKQMSGRLSICIALALLVSGIAMIIKLSHPQDLKI